MEKQIPDCPECDKLVKVAPDSQKIGNFIDWLHEQGMELCTWSDVDQGYFDCHENTENLLARYFKIDLKTVEQERQALLGAIRANILPSANRVA